MSSSPVDTASLAHALHEETAAALGLDQADLPGQDPRTLRERGLKSLQAIRIQYRLQERCGIQVGLGELLDARDLSALARQLAGAATAVLPQQE